MTDASAHLLVLLVVSGTYLTLVRFVDVNEREPVWSLCLAFVLGGLAAGVVRLLMDPVTRVLAPWAGAAAEEIAKCTAYVACLLIFAGIARIRGWFELSDLVDGIVYGITIGLGFSVGDTFLRDLSLAPFPIEPLAFRPGSAIVNGVLGGLGHGLFGGVTGLGVGLAVESRGKVSRAMLPVLGLAGAVALNGLFRLLAHGNALGGQAGVYRAWLVVVIPMIALVGIGLLGLARERKTIAIHLSPEVAGGALSAEDLALLDSFWRRQQRYLGLLAGGRVHECLSLAGRHNRHVQLALAKARVAGERDAARIASLGRQIEALRRASRHSLPVLLVLCLVGTLAAAVRIALPLQIIGTPNDGVTRVLGLAVPQLDSYWRAELPLKFTAPAVGPYSQFSLTCRFRSNNAVFCRPDGNIYYDPGFLNELHESIGDFAPVVVIAHEYGHKAQSLQEARADWPIKDELQADCYAGEWTKHVESAGMLEKGDRGEALEVLNRGRDPRFYPWYDPQAHGSAGQRVDAFNAGHEGISCRSDSLWIAVHLDPAAAPQTATPPSGSLLARVARKRGRFTMVDIKVLPDFIKGSRTEVIEARYRTPDGVELILRRGAYTSALAASEDLRGDSTIYMGKGYAPVRQGPVKDGDRELGRWLLLDGEYEVVILTNLQLYDFIIAPKGIAWEFATSSVP